MKLLKNKNYLNSIKKSVGTEIFQNVFTEESNTEKDLTRDGQLSCALFVSSILKIFDLINPLKSPHSTISGLLKNMKDSGWTEIKQLELSEGDVIVWEKIIDVDGEEHEHIGFYIGNERAVSNSSEKRVPTEHHYNYEGKRAIESCFRAPSL
jgi:hypothetical protein